MTEKPKKSLLPETVFPSTTPTVIAEDADDVYGGAHKYKFLNCLGFADGKTQYEDVKQTIRFVQKKDDGTIVPGLQSEQVVIALIDRQKKLNARFPSPFAEKAIKGLEMFLEAQRERVEERINRGVMGDLKK
jgi:hypothetical protein